MLTKYLLLGLPETMSIILVSLVLTRARLPAIKFFLLSIASVILIIIIREVSPFPFGLHSIISMVFLWLSLTFLSRIQTSRALLSVMFSFTLLLFYEILFLSLIFKFTGLNISNVHTDSYLSIAFGMPHVFAMFGTAYILSNKNVQI